MKSQPDSRFRRMPITTPDSERQAMAQYRLRVHPSCTWKCRKNAGNPQNTPGRFPADEESFRFPGRGLPFLISIHERLRWSKAE